MPRKSQYEKRKEKQMAEKAAARERKSRRRVMGLHVPDDENKENRQDSSGWSEALQTTINTTVGSTKALPKEPAPAASTVTDSTVAKTGVATRKSSEWASLQQSTTQSLVIDEETKPTEEVVDEDETESEAEEEEERPNMRQMVEQYRKEQAEEEAETKRKFAELQKKAREQNKKRAEKALQELPPPSSDSSEADSDDSLVPEETLVPEEETENQTKSRATAKKSITLRDVIR